VTDVQNHAEDARNYQKRRFVSSRPVELDGVDVGVVHPVVVIGAGPVGLTTAIDLARQGVGVLLLDNDDSLSSGSRAICFAKRSLEIFDRLDCAKPMMEKGVRWNVGKVFLQEELIYSFDLLPEGGHAYPAFINLQQYYVEGFLVERALEERNLQIRWKNEIVDILQREDCVELTVDSPDGRYVVLGAYVVAADGSRSPIRKSLGLDSHGRTFKDRFLIADVKMKAPFPTERWFWFDPPFHRNQSVLLHKQPDDVWRVDFQLGWDADPEFEKRPENVIPRVKALLGEDTEFELEWVSVYTFSCLRMDEFRHGRVLFAGDSAHGVSPFGARGANSGVQDADNLAWKLRLVLEGDAPDRLLDTYASEREYAADENILNSTRATDFITPKTATSRLFRDATLKLAKDFPFARSLVNSGRLSVPAILADSTLTTPDLAGDRFSASTALGAACKDAPVVTEEGPGWFLEQLRGSAFVGVYFLDDREETHALVKEWKQLCSARVPLRILVVAPQDTDGGIDIQGRANLSQVTEVDGVLSGRFDARPGSFYLIRPDQHLCARWRKFDTRRVMAAVSRATCNS
jgi:3-(3-hydroxy-phenyl)propionate hydroxylase